MPEGPNPALERFAAQIAGEVEMAQLLIRRLGRGYELRHVQDREATIEYLRTVEVHDLRGLAQFTGIGAFRPLRSARTLATGWRAVLANDAQLELALNHVYPGAIADWFAARAEATPITHYREFAGRQTGMYQITQQLSDTEVAEVIQVCCGPACCLKRRLWSVTGLPPDLAPQKSIIPCLEPCAVLLEAARKACRPKNSVGEISPEKD